MDKKTIVFAGPSAVGKTYTAEQLTKLYPQEFEFAKLYTTRTPRTSEVVVDRIFVSTTEFNRMIKDNMFIVYDNFGGNFYGFTEKSLYPTDKHLLLNAWPWLIPEFSIISHTIIIGMQAPLNWVSSLEKRMKKRGDSKETIVVRLKLIEKDILDLQINKKIVESNGKFFTIDTDKTTHDEIIPWLEEKLGLKT